MDQTRLTYLLEQHHLNRCTPAEQAELDEWYDTLDDPNYTPKYIDGTAEADAYVNKQYEQFLQKSGRAKRTFRLPGWAKIAAILAVIIAAAVYLYTGVQTGTERSTTQVAIASNRYVTLPDSSVVVLAEGSTIEFFPSFGKTDRNLVLKGEAYFDVQHNPSLPFVIHTGKVTTTVLGTAFNIKQFGDSVAVTVTRGKVKVAYGDIVLAELTPGKQLIADQHNRIAEMNEPAVKEVTEWMQDGLHFENISLGEAVKELQQRYTKNIVLKTPGIEKCSINVVTPFNGTEHLETILEVIGTMLGAQINYNGETIEITGQPCAEK